MIALDKNVTLCKYSRMHAFNFKKPTAIGVPLSPRKQQFSSLRGLGSSFSPRTEKGSRTSFKLERFHQAAWLGSLRNGPFPFGSHLGGLTDVPGGVAAELWGVPCAAHPLPGQRRGALVLPASFPTAGGSGPGTNDTGDNFFPSGCIFIAPF